VNGEKEWKKHGERKGRRHQEKLKMFSELHSIQNLE
jgi:hypothetical protein